MTYNLKEFGEKLRFIRRNLNYTQSYIYRDSGIHPDTLRKIEGGKVIPKIETLDNLSFILKTDITALFLEYRIDDYSYFKDVKGSLEAKLDCLDYKNISPEIRMLNKLSSMVKNPYHKNLIKQLTHFATAISFSEKQDFKAVQEKLIEALKLTTPKFKLSNYPDFAYSSMEVRILMNIAFVRNDLGYKDEYLNLMRFCLTQVEQRDNLYPIVCHNLATSYYRNKMYIEALKYAQLGIEACKQSRVFNQLHSLYYMKGLAEYRLEDKEYIRSIKMTIFLCEAYGLHDVKKIMISKCNRFLNSQHDFKKDCLFQVDD